MHVRSSVQSMIKTRSIPNMTQWISSTSMVKESLRSQKIYLQPQKLVLIFGIAIRKTMDVLQIGYAGFFLQWSSMLPSRKGHDQGSSLDDVL